MGITANNSVKGFHFIREVDLESHPKITAAAKECLEIFERNSFNHVHVQVVFNLVEHLLARQPIKDIAKSLI